VVLRVARALCGTHHKTSISPAFPAYFGLPIDKNGEFPWSCLAPGEARMAEIWHASDETAVLAWRLAAASPAILASSRDGE
jgi:hypothetical protein